MQMEGATMRITITAPLFDTLKIYPLANSGVSSGLPLIVDRKVGGKFTATLNTQQYATPWYRLEFVGQTTKVEEVGENNEIVVSPNPAESGTVSVYVTETDSQIRVYSVTGEEVLRHAVAGTNVSMDVSTLPAGVYVVSVLNGASVRGSTTLLIR